MVGALTDTASLTEFFSRSNVISYINKKGIKILLSPAEFIVYRFGGVRKTARAIGRTPSTISKWHSHRADGHIPVGIQKHILYVAENMGLDITPSDLILGRNVKKSDITR